MDTKKGVLKENHHLKFTRLRIIKNVTVISFAFALLFSAYDGLSMLQSTMNGKQGMGSASQAVVYFSFAVSSLLLPKYTIKKLGCKMTLFVGVVLYIPYIAANVYPTWITMMTSAALLGIGSGILWAAQSKYFNEASGIYCKIAEGGKPGNINVTSKLGSTNFELLVIQNGIKDRMPPKTRLKSECIISSQGYEEMLMNDCKTDYVSSRAKIISEINQDLEQMSSNTETHSGKETELYTQNAKNHNMSINPPTRAISISSTNNEESPDDKMLSKNMQNIDLYLQDSVVKDFVEYTEKEIDNDLKINTQSQSPIDPNVNKGNNTKMPSTEKFLRHENISENSSKLCTLESITARFFGCFGMMYSAAQIWSNLLSYYVLSINRDENVTLVSNHSCGAGFCNSEFEVITGDSDEISSSTRYLLIGITVILSVFSSLLLFVFLDPLETREEGVKFSLSHATATFNHLKKKEQLYLIPLSMFSGMTQGFYTADFTRSYIQCACSISYVGLVTVSLGIACGILCTISGWLVKYVGRLPVVLAGLALHLGTDAFLLIWNPSVENHFMFYLAAALWGAKLGLFYTQIQAIYGLLFKNDEEAAFATNYFCGAMGWTISFAYSNYLCTSTKIYILMVVSCIGILGYLAADQSFRQRKNS